ncbi:MAG: dTDP-4-dehydrorhamnose reductase [Candidatus Cloacimonetes bacterium]|nr:dTDP-4-dehydrorhamnose reductase [Candidatus Cloacimonadota bacterium]
MAKFLITGGDGMFAYAIKEHPFFAEHTSYGSKDFNLLNYQQMEEQIQKDKPEYLINCAAYTNVTKAETEQELAYKVNAEAVKDLTELSNKYDFRLVQISTDFVFKGNDYIAKKESDPIDPVNIYGESKAVGEVFVISHAHNCLIFRVSWLFGPKGNNFISNIAELIKTRDELNVISDQYGRLTYTIDAADALAKLIKNSATGIYHFANEGIASRFQIALDIELLLNKYGFATKSFIKPILAKEYIDKTPRPTFSILDTEKIEKTLDIKIRNWKEALADFLKV